MPASRHLAPYSGLRNALGLSLLAAAATLAQAAGPLAPLQATLQTSAGQGAGQASANRTVDVPDVLRSSGGATHGGQSGNASAEALVEAQLVGFGTTASAVAEWPWAADGQNIASASSSVRWQARVVLTGAAPVGLPLPLSALHVPLLAIGEINAAAQEQSPANPGSGSGSASVVLTRQASGEELKNVALGSVGGGQSWLEMVFVDALLGEVLNVHLSAQAVGFGIYVDDPGYVSSVGQAVGSASLDFLFDEFGFEQHLRDIGAPTLFAAADYFHIELSAAAPAAVPEPGTYALWLAGLGLMGTTLRRRPAGKRRA